MPIYEYQCQECGNGFEEMVLPRHPEPAACPVCGGGVSRMVSAPSFHLKGGGWYVSDYKSPNPATKPTESESPTAAEPSVAPAVAAPEPPPTPTKVEDAS